jgi:type IV pilus assembly protein PilW
MEMKQASIHGSGGFTLTELMVSMAIGMVVLAGVTTTFMSQTRIYNAQEQVNEMEQNARGALDLIAREIKMAGFKPAGGTFAGIAYNTNALRIQADLVGNDGLTTGTNEDITYTYDNANKRIRRAASGSTETVAENIDSFDFAYLDSNGNNTAVQADIRAIAISITARTAKPDPNYTSDNGYRTYNVSTRITAPNLAL